MIEIICNDRTGKKVRVKCDSGDIIGDLKRLIAAQTGTRAEKIVLKRWSKYITKFSFFQVPEIKFVFLFR